MISDFSFSVSVLNSVEPVLTACKYKATVKTMNNQQMKNWIPKRQFRMELQLAQTLKQRSGSSEIRFFCWSV